MYISIIFLHVLQVYMEIDTKQTKVNQNENFN